MSNESLQDATERPVVVTVTTDGRVSIRLPFRRNPYESAVGQPLTDVPGIVAAQFGTYPNPHLLCSLQLCELPLGLVPTAQVRMLRYCAGVGIRVREYGLHFANCIRAGVFRGRGGDIGELLMMAMETAQFGRLVERTVAGERADAPRLIVGGAKAPEPEQLRAAAAQLPRAKTFIGELITAFVALQTDLTPGLVAEAANIQQAIRYDIGPLLSVGYADVLPAEVGQAVPGRYVWKALAPRGQLKHTIMVGADGRLESGEVVTPTERKRPVLEALLGQWVRQGRGTLSRTDLERDLVDVIRVSNPCGVDVSGDFVQFVWE